MQNAPLKLCLSEVATFDLSVGYLFKFDRNIHPKPNLRTGGKENCLTHSQLPFRRSHRPFTMDSSSSSDIESVLSEAPAMTSAPSSPPAVASPKSDVLGQITENSLLKEEREARDENRKAEEDKSKVAGRKPRKKKKAETKAEREAKARELDELLMKSAAFSDILTKKTQVLGRVGSSLDGKALGEHNLQMAEQPKCMIGGTMRDYQLEGLTWMFEICSQGMSGILADEMGLGL